jgi:phage terminase large subunit-like protein
VIDYDVIRRDINELARSTTCASWPSTAGPRRRSRRSCSGDGFDVVPFGQGYASMSPPSKEFEKLVLARRAAGNTARIDPVLRWMASNVAIETTRPGNIKPSEDELSPRSTERIDGIVGHESWRA